MSIRIQHDDWLPRGIESLEDAAWDVALSNCNCVVIAGPGAGKTELLAQRASFLLETGECSPPRRILSISFKRDAAKNIATRVEKRCGELAQRFDSFTFDSFAKALVDRFSSALPKQWRPKNNYRVLVDVLNADQMRGWLIRTIVPGALSEDELQALSRDEIKRLFDLMAHGCLLPYDSDGIKPHIKDWGLAWWHQQLSVPDDRQSISFPMLNRLAAFLLRQNPKIRNALRATYSQVFVDEFQDTTEAQYDLVLAAFHESSSVITAVGDSRQRIMLWAGAMPEVFEEFSHSFNAKPFTLIRNFRSASELVRIQHVIVKALNAGQEFRATSTFNGGSCRVLEFSDPEFEADYLANIISSGIQQEGRKPREFCVLCRQQTAKIIGQLQNSLSRIGIQLRDESQLQDLLAEPVTGFILSVLKLATRNRDPEAWETVCAEVAKLSAFHPDEDTHMIQKRAQELINTATSLLSSGVILREIPQRLIQIADSELFRATYRQYQDRAFFDKVLANLQEHLGREAEGKDARSAVDAFIGENVVPAMTIHKSKGLEFHTVIFIGLEDTQWWNFRNQEDEEKRSFFVAFSRAIERVYFTYCDFRDGRYGREGQERTQINDLYSILQRAGVKTQDCRRTADVVYQ